VKEIKNLEDVSMQIKSKEQDRKQGSPVLHKIGAIGMTKEEILLNKKLLLKIDERRGVG
jgi:hypothetical protein